MTLGQRIQELRKQRGMSQERLGDALGVSRQAVSKWEGDNGIPELDTLIAMSRLFDVTVGQLLGVEEAAEQDNKSTVNTEEDKSEAILRRYVQETAGKDERSRFLRWGGIVSEAIIVTTVFIVLFAQLGSLRSTVRLLQHDLSSLRGDVSNSQNNLSGQIRSTIYDVLAEEANLLSTLQWELTAYDDTHQTVTLRLNATMKEYSAGSRLQFCANWRKSDKTSGQITGNWATGPDFQSEIILPLNNRTELSIRLEDADGNIREQVLQTPIHELSPDNFRLSAYQLATPFAIIVKHFGTIRTTAKAEHAYIKLISPFPDFFRPENAVLTAYLNGTEIMRETMTITESTREENTFLASIKNTYHDLIMIEDDVLEINLTVTDDLGRTEEFTDRIVIKDGKQEHTQEATPVISAEKKKTLF